MVMMAYSMFRQSCAHDLVVTWVNECRDLSMGYEVVYVPFGRRMWTVLALSKLRVEIQILSWVCLLHTHSKESRLR